MKMSLNEDILWTELFFEVSPAGICEDEQLKQLLQIIEETSRENELKKLIKQILEMYRNSIDQKNENAEAKNILLQFFTRFNSKKALRKHLQDLVGKSNLSSLIIKSTTEEILANIDNKKCNINQCEDLLNFVYVMQNFVDFDYEMTIEYLFPFYYIVFEGFVYHSKLNFEKVSSVLEKLFDVINVVLKQMLIVFVKNVSYITTVSDTYSLKLIVLAHLVVIHESIGFDLKTKAGLIFTHSLNIIPEKFRTNFKYIDCPQLNFLGEFNEEKYFTLNNNKMPVFEHSDTIVIIYSSILNVVPQQILFEVTINGKKLISSLYKGLMNCARRYEKIIIIGFTNAVCSRIEQGFGPSPRVTSQLSDDPEHPDYVPFINMGYKTILAVSGELRLTRYKRLMDRNKMVLEEAPNSFSRPTRLKSDWVDLSWSVL